MRYSIWGETRTNHVEVICTCHCDDDDGSIGMYCKVYLWMTIYLDDRYALPLSSYVTIQEKRETYGHEQQHITSMQSLVLSEVMPFLETAEGWEFRSMDECQDRSDRVEAAEDSIIETRWLIESAHRNDGSPENGEPVGPIGDDMP